MKADGALRYLKAHPNEWIPVTTDETVDALRELKRQGIRIVTKFEDDGRYAKYTPPEPMIDLVAEAERVFGDDVMSPAEVQAKIKAAMEVGCEHPDPITDDMMREVCRICGEVLKDAPPVVSPGTAGRPFPMRMVQTGKDTWRVETTEQKRCECGDLYLVLEDHVKGFHHQNWLRGETQIEVPTPDPEPLYKFPFGQVPTRFEVGEIVVCPSCKNKRRKGSDHTSITGKSAPCTNCNGNGMVPNVGTIARGAMPDGPAPTADAAGAVAAGQLGVDAQRTDEGSDGVGGPGGDPADDTAAGVSEAGGGGEPVHEDPQGDRPGPEEPSAGRGRRRVRRTRTTGV